MPKQKYLCIQRSQPGESGSCEPPSPAQMEEMYAKFNTWKEKFRDKIVDMGGKLGGGKVVTSESTLDGPFVEVKEVVGGFMIVEAESLEEAVEVARESPGVYPGASVEVRENQYALTAPALVEHFFRHEYSKLVAMLSARVGVQHIEAIEDAVQSALMRALDAWKIGSQPDNPSAWLYRVALNNVMGEFRQQSNRHRILEQNIEELINTPESDPEYFPAQTVRDDLLRMFFVCCDESIPAESQLVLALKTLCGFSVQEIALRLFTNEANVYKRLTRARNRLRKMQAEFGDLTSEQYSSRLSGVHKILYLLFTEGYLSSHSELAIRKELCTEAIRLTTILAEHPVGWIPETCALLSLMHLHVARMTARQSAAGGLLLLEEQDRTRWDSGGIQRGLAWLAQSAQGDEFSRYHAEASIAAEHCLAPSFQETRWDRVVESYELLERVAPSAIHKLNCAVAVAEWRGPEEGLATLKSFEPPSWLVGSYLWVAVLADLHRRCGHKEKAMRYKKEALALAPTSAIAELLERRLQVGTF